MPECFLADVSIPLLIVPLIVPILLFLLFVVVVAIIVRRTQRNEARSYRLLPVRRNRQHPRRAPRIGLFTSTISHPPHDRVSRARLAHLRRDLNGTGIRVIAIEAVTTGSTQQRQYRHIRNLMRRAAHTLKGSMSYFYQGPAKDSALSLENSARAVIDFVEKTMASRKPAAKKARTA